MVVDTLAQIFAAVPIIFPRGLGWFVACQIAARILDTAKWVSMDALSTAGLPSAVHDIAAKLTWRHCSAAAVDAASAAGRLNLHWWFAQTTFPLAYSGAAIDLASGNSHLDVLEFWHETAALGLRAVPSPDAIALAISRGHVDVVQWWLHPDRSGFLAAACMSDRAAVVKYSRAAVAAYDPAIFALLRDRGLLASWRAMQFYAAAVGNLELLAEFTATVREGGNVSGPTALGPEVADVFSQADIPFNQLGMDFGAIFDNLDSVSKVYTGLACMASRHGQVAVLEWIVDGDNELDGQTHGLRFQSCVKAAISAGQVVALEWLNDAMGEQAFRAAAERAIDAATPANGQFLAHVIRTDQHALATWFLDVWLPTVADNRREITPDMVLACAESSARDVLVGLAAIPACLDDIQALLAVDATKRACDLALVRVGDADMVAWWRATLSDIGTHRDVLKACAKYGRIDLLARVRDAWLTHVLLAEASSHGQLAVLALWIARGLPVKLTAAALQFDRVAKGCVGYKVTCVLRWWARHGGQGRAFKVSTSTLLNLARRDEVTALDAIATLGFIDAGEGTRNAVVTSATRHNSARVMRWASERGWVNET